MSMKYVVIMAGGIGSRFWPVSTQQKPKQFIDILGIGRSLLQMTYDRVLPLVDPSNIIIMTHADYASLVMEQLPDLPERNILCEPSRNNTAPCIAFAALHIQARDPHASFAVLSSDHIILREGLFRSLLAQGFEICQQKGVIVTMGISPTRPDTGYGYIEVEAGTQAPFSVQSFKEKPDIETAKAYISTGHFFWNAGIFIWRVDTILDAFRLYEPTILEVLDSDSPHYGSTTEQEHINRYYPSTKSISIDYAILERAENVYCIPAEIGWSDLGTWDSLHAYLAEGSGDQLVTVGEKIVPIDCSNSIIVSHSPKTLLIRGLSDFIIVDTDKALLIYPKSKEQEIKQSLSTHLIQ